MNKRTINRVVPIIVIAILIFAIIIIFLNLIGIIDLFALMHPASTAAEFCK